MAKITVLQKKGFLQHIKLMDFQLHMEDRERLKRKANGRVFDNMEEYWMLEK